MKNPLRFQHILPALFLSLIGCDTGPSAPDSVVLNDGARVQSTPAVEVARLGDISAVHRNGNIVVSWAFPDAPAPVSVYGSERPYSQDRQRLAHNLVADSMEIPVKPEQRQYFFVETAPDQGRWVSTRVLPLEGGRNFRDLGGYATGDGRYTRWGTLYRSGTLAGLTENDINYLHKLGIAVVCDFRSNEERAAEPTPWQALGQETRYLHWQYSYRSDESWGDMRQWLSVTSDMTASQARSLITESYRDAPTRFGDRYKALFETLLANRAPLTFHCSAGKDRTGLAAGLILYALGVPRETILRDYALSETVVDYEKEIHTEAEAGNNPLSSAIAAMDPAARRALMRSDPAYLEAAFTGMEQQFGSIDAYLEQVLGVDSEARAQLQSLYLTAQ
ncbi:MAG: hypothetical protein CMK32_13835 [Porticoccaceae bacterium]|nr:hypothetical protein [Porticoccaceae bacterium]